MDRDEGVGEQKLKLYSALALNQMLDNDADGAKLWLVGIPRSLRGRLSIALDDLHMALSRLGRDYESHLQTRITTLEASMRALAETFESYQDAESASGGKLHRYARQLREVLDV
jgi:hypothetical protein